MNNLTLQKDYTIDGQEYQLVLPMNVEVLIPKDDSVRLLSKITEGLNYTKLMQAYSKKGRNPGISPITMFRVILYAFMIGITSTRMIERACKQNINFMWLLRGEPAPDHNTIHRFIKKRFSKASIDLHTQMIERLVEVNEVDLRQLYIDGTKIEANANKYTFVWLKSTNKYYEKLKVKVEKFFIELSTKYWLIEEFEEDLLVQMEDILKRLNKKAKQENIVFVYGKGKRKTQKQKDIEELQEYVEKMKKYESYHKIFRGRNSFSKTDHDATFMRMKDDHMRNGQLKAGYNLQLAVSGEYIVGIDVSCERSDNKTLIGFLNSLERQYGNRFLNIVGDAGYESEENYKYLESKGYVSYIKPVNHEMKKKRKYKEQIGRRENMIYDEENDEFICHNNRRLKFISTTTKKKDSGYEVKSRVYECESCDDCGLRAKCYKGKFKKRIYFSEAFAKYREESQKNIESEEGILLRVNRSIQVEGAFGVLKQDHKFNRFKYRGQFGVYFEALLYAMAFNVNKLHNKIQDNRLGLSFFYPKTSEAA